MLCLKKEKKEEKWKKDNTKKDRKNERHKYKYRGSLTDKYHVSVTSETIHI